MLLLLWIPKPELGFERLWLGAWAFRSLWLIQALWIRAGAGEGRVEDVQGRLGTALIDNPNKPQQGPKAPNSP